MCIYNCELGLKELEWQILFLDLKYIIWDNTKYFLTFELKTFIYINKKQFWEASFGFDFKITAQPSFFWGKFKCG